MPILYLFFGGLTTLINIAAYYAASHLLGMDTVPATVLAWVIAVLFAYLTNRKWVFDSRASGAGAILRELAGFWSARLFTGLLDIGIMYLFVDVLHRNDMFIKLASNVIVVILNYVFSKYLIFKR